jgi:predicted neuraminidase
LFKVAETSPGSLDQRVIRQPLGNNGDAIDQVRRLQQIWTIQRSPAALQQRSSELSVVAPR